MCGTLVLSVDDENGSVYGLFLEGISWPSPIHLLCLLPGLELTMPFFGPCVLHIH